MHIQKQLSTQIQGDTCLGGEVAARLELLEEGRQEDGGEEEDDAPEQDVGDVGAVGAAGTALELPMQHLALLLAPEDMAVVMMMMMMMMLIRMASRRRRRTGIMSGSDGGQG